MVVLWICIGGSCCLWPWRIILVNGDGRNADNLRILQWTEYLYHRSNGVYGESPRRKTAEVMSRNKEYLYSCQTKERQRCEPAIGRTSCIQGILTEYAHLFTRPLSPLQVKAAWSTKWLKSPLNICAFLSTANW